MSTIALLTNILKDDYGDYVRSFNDDCWILDNAIPASKESFVGLRAVHAIHTARSSGVGSRGDNATLPAASNQTVKRIMIPMRRHYGRIAITGPTMKQATTAPGAFIEALKLEMEGIRKDYGRDLSRQVWGTSNGAIAACASDNNGNPTCVITLAAATTKTQVYQVFADGGMNVDCGTVANPTLRFSNKPVVDYDVTTPGSYTVSVTADGTGFAVAGTDFLFRTGNGGASDNTGNDNDGQFELTGLQTAISNTSTLHALSVANGSKIWQSSVFANGGTTRPPTETLIMNACMEVANKSGENVDVAVCNGGVMLSLINMLISSKRHVTNLDSGGNMSNLKLKAGASGISVTVPGWGGNGSGLLPIVADRDAPANGLYGLHFGSMRKYQHTAPEWADDDGSVLHWDNSKDRYEAFLRSYLEMGYVRRNTMFAITDLEEATS